MTGPERDHAAFDELAAGFVLHALDSEDEQRFLRHVRDCPHCPEILTGFTDVAAALAETAPAVEPPPSLGERIMAVVRADLAGDGQAAASQGDPRTAQPRAPQTPSRETPSGAPGADAGGGQAEAPGAVPAAEPAEPPPGRVIPLARRPVPRWLRPAAAAAAAIVIGGGIWAGLAATGPNPPSFPSSCVHQRGCAQVAVLSTATHQQAARVVVLNGSVYLTPARIPANNRSDQIYVLWQIPRGRAPLAVGSFDVRSGPNAALKIGALVVPYGHTAAFAISLEPGRRIPAAPTKVVAAGPVT